MNARRRRPPTPDSDGAFFFDIDGTLAEIVDAPGTAQVDPALRALLATLHRASGGALALISGRTLDAIDALFPEHRYPAAGQHGTERRTADGLIACHPFAAARMEQLRDRVAASVDAHPGIVLEDKGGSLALHYRHAPALAGFVHRIARTSADEYGPEIAVQRGKRVVELLPTGQNKGRAVTAFLEETPFRGRLPVFVGDDVTDESAFAVVNALRGISVKVGPGRSIAQWRLSNVAEVRAWIGAAR